MPDVVGRNDKAEIAKRHLQLHSVRRTRLDKDKSRKHPGDAGVFKMGFECHEATF